MVRTALGRDAIPLTRRAVCIGVLAGLVTMAEVIPGFAQSGPPTRDPKQAGYVTAKELADGTNPPTDGDGNFILGPTHPAPGDGVYVLTGGSVIEFTMNSADSVIYPGIAREAGTFGTIDPKDPARLVVTTSHAAPYTRKVAVYVPKTYVAGAVAPFMVGADGPDPMLFFTVDRLITQHRLPAMIVISMSSPMAA